MNRLIALCALATATATATALAMPAQAVILNLDGKLNAGLNDANGIALALTAGTYKFSFVQDQYTAFNRFSSATNCNIAGGNCRTGFENSVRWTLDGDNLNPFKFGDGNASGGMGPQTTTGGYYLNAATSFANSGVFTSNFTFASPVTLKAFIFDDNLSDNSGGISLNIARTPDTAVPEPASWAMLIAGFGLIGAVMRRRRRAAATAA